MTTLGKLFALLGPVSLQPAYRRCLWSWPDPPPVPASGAVLPRWLILINRLGLGVTSPSWSGMMDRSSQTTSLDFRNGGRLSSVIMQRTSYFFRVLPLLVAGLLVGRCGVSADAQPYVLKIVATGNVNGEIEPCG